MCYLGGARWVWNIDFQLLQLFVQDAVQNGTNIQDDRCLINRLWNSETASTKLHNTFIPGIKKN